MNPFDLFIAQQMAQPQLAAGAMRSQSAVQLEATISELAASVLGHIRANPGAEVRTIAAALSATTEQLYPVLQKLKRGGLIAATGRIGNGNTWSAI